MSNKVFRKWSSPRTVLVVVRASDDPPQVLFAMRQAVASGAKLVLAQVSADDSASRSRVVRQDDLHRLSSEARCPILILGSAIEGPECVRDARTLRQRNKQPSGCRFRTVTIEV
jgi:hypothetical protein